MIIVLPAVTYVYANSNLGIIGTVVTDNKNISYAVIKSRDGENHKIYKVGDVVGKHFIESIERERVVLKPIEDQNDGSEQGDNKCKQVRIDLDNAELGALISIINQFSNKSYSTYKDVNEKKITLISPSPVNVINIDEYFETILEIFNLSTIDNINHTEVVPNFDRVSNNKSCLNNKNIKKDISPILPISSPIKIDFDNVDICVFIKFISEITLTNFALNPFHVNGSVKEKHQKIPMKDAYSLFKTILPRYKYDSIESEYVTKIVPISH